MYGSNLCKLVFLPVGTNPASQVRPVDFLGRVTAPRVFLCEFALLEMITELSNGHCAGIRCSAIGVDFQDQPRYGAPRGILIRVSLDCADNLFVVKTLAVTASYRPSKLPDFRTSLAVEPLSLSIQPSCIRLLLSSCAAVAEQKESSGIVAIGGCRRAKSAK